MTQMQEPWPTGFFMGHHWGLIKQSRGRAYFQHPPTQAETMRDAADWENWPSAMMEEKEDIHRLIREAEGKLRASAR